MLKQFKKGFTLAEVLIVIGIIGVVAALTLPNLNHATGDKEKVTRVKKAYSILSEAFDRAQAIYGPYNEWFKDLTNTGTSNNWVERNERFAKRVTEFLKVSKDCGINEGCFADDENDDKDSLHVLQYNGTYMVLLSDSMALGFIDFSHNNDDKNAMIRVDIDGPNKGKAKGGNDIFAFDIYKNQLIPGGGYGYNPEASDEDLANNCLNLNYCTEWVVENGNLDYLNATNGECPNGVQLSWTQTSCN